MATADPWFDACLPLILKEEGGNDDDPRDHGGRTSRGVIQREYDKWRQAKGLATRDVWTASTQEIHDIYYEKYWLPKCPKLHPGVDLSYFNICVNAGPGRAGPILLASIGGTDAETVERFNDHVVRFYRGLGQFPIYGKGWLARSARIHAAAQKMLSSPQKPTTEIPVATGTPAVLPVDQIETLVESAEKLLGYSAGMIAMLLPANLKPAVPQIVAALPKLELMLKLESAREHATDPVTLAQAEIAIYQAAIDKTRAAMPAAAQGTGGAP